jgi:hypothetical protein
VLDIVCGAAVWRDTAEEIAVAFGVDQRERHRRPDLVAKGEAILADGLALGRIADDHDGQMRTEAVD